ncbi:MAG: hypothetical protein HZB76_05010 [Chlamydiae bacterium]|nr:hypothetical protein [Chlamydiota bacterium]
MCVSSGGGFRLSRRKLGTICLSISGPIGIEATVALIASGNGGITDTQFWKICNFAALVFATFIFIVGYNFRHDSNRVVSLSLRSTSSSHVRQDILRLSGRGSLTALSRDDNHERPPTRGTPLDLIKEALAEASSSAGTLKMDPETSRDQMLQ